MAFYIKPPNGTLFENKLYDFVMKRLAFLYYIHDHTVEDVRKIILKEALAKNSECLIEGTVKDKISHFMLRFLCNSSSMLQDFFIQNETKLFSYRLQFCDFLKIQRLLQKSSKQSKDILLNNTHILKSYVKVLKSVIFIWEELNIAIKEKRSFVNGLEFVKNRLYPLNLGYLRLPLTDIKLLMTYLFQELLIQGMNQMKGSLCMKACNEPRMQYLEQKIQKWVYSHLHPVRIYNRRLFHESNLTEASKKFPLCMRNLHNILLNQHRLKHTSRIQFTLFLKEVGVPVAEVIKLFMKEYSKPLDKGCDDRHAHCSHNWNDSEKRYIYGIEHLYGLRGACKDYKAHKCSSLQNSYDNDGGCPFVSFDDHHLQKTLESENFMVKDIEDILKVVHKKEYNKACSFYLLCKIKNLHNNQQNLQFSHQSSIFCSSDNTGYKCTNSVPLDAGKPKKDLPLCVSSLNFNCPPDFYSILSSYVDI